MGINACRSNLWCPWMTAWSEAFHPWESFNSVFALCWRNSLTIPMCPSLAAVINDDLQGNKFILVKNWLWFSETNLLQVDFLLSVTDEPNFEQTEPGQLSGIFCWGVNDKKVLSRTLQTRLGLATIMQWLIYTLSWHFSNICWHIIISTAIIYKLYKLKVFEYKFWMVLTKYATCLLKFILTFCSLSCIFRIISKGTLHN